MAVGVKNGPAHGDQEEKGEGRISSRQNSGGEKCSLYTKKYYKPLDRKSGQGVRSLKTSTTPTAVKKMLAG